MLMLMCAHKSLVARGGLKANMLLWGYVETHP